MQGTWSALPVRSIDLAVFRSIMRLQEMSTRTIRKHNDASRRHSNAHQKTRYDQSAYYAMQAHHRTIPKPPESCHLRVSYQFQMTRLMWYLRFLTKLQIHWTIPSQLLVYSI